MLARTLVMQTVQNKGEKLLSGLPISHAALAEASQTQCQFSTVT